jgi:hypothetical protein
MPFSEKIDHIAHGKYSVTPFVNHHVAKLKYFADMRNQIVHGFRLDHEHYLLASDHAVGAIKTITEHLVTPPVVGSVCSCVVPVITVERSVHDVLTLMQKYHATLLPVYDE